MGVEHGDYRSYGGTTCTSVTFSSEQRCPHTDGWYATVTFLGVFKKRIFVCSDCGEVLPGDWKAPTF